MKAHELVGWAVVAVLGYVVWQELQTPGGALTMATAGPVPSPATVAPQGGALPPSSPNVVSIDNPNPPVLYAPVPIPNNPPTPPTAAMPTPGPTPVSVDNQSPVIFPVGVVMEGGGDASGGGTIDGSPLLQM